MLTPQNTIAIVYDYIDQTPESGSLAQDEVVFLPASGITAVNGGALHRNW